MALSRNCMRSLLRNMTGKSQQISIASTCYIGLLTADPTHDDNDNVVFAEVTGPGYERVLIGNYQAAVSQALSDPSDDGTTANTLSILFPEAEDDWGTVTHFALFSAKESGEPHLWGALTSPVTISQGYVALFKPGTLSITLT